MALVPAGARRDVRERRLLGDRARRPRRPERAAQPRHRGAGAPARRPQVALLGGVLRPRDLRPALRRREPRRRQAALRPRGQADQPLRQGGEETMTLAQKAPRATLPIGDAVASLLREGMPVRFTAYDGSAAGPPDAEIGLALVNQRGLAYLLTAPGDLGMARAYVSGDLKVHGVHPGDPYDALKLLQNHLRFRKPTAAEALTLVRGLGISNLKPPPPPPQ